MFEWLLAPIDPSRIHDVSGLVAWHGRFMVLAWGGVIPSGVLIARFFKVTPRQNWPQELDNQFWWYCHLILQSSGGGFMLLGLGLILFRPEDASLFEIHVMLGWFILVFAGLQFLAGWLRGSKGGPAKSDPQDDGCSGDHYDMTRKRCAFEYFHKNLGYVLLIFSVGAILTGLWQSNAPVWMWLVLVGWWLCLLLGFVVLQRRAYALDTYQAIWGPDKTHPGNQLKPIGWGVKRK